MKLLIKIADGATSQLEDIQTQARQLGASSFSRLMPPEDLHEVFEHLYAMDASPEDCTMLIEHFQGQPYVAYIYSPPARGLL